ncbi:MAG: 4Fe-4S binding protein, partial [Candidatus Brocadiae bacterium]|nr:4Fe-4S binding protein [Candidatus Brocadiia bacterium]
IQGSGAGIAAAQLVANSGAEAVVAGNFGPNAFQALSQGGLQLFTAGPGGTVRQLVEAFNAGQLQPLAGANVAAHFGVGGGAAGAPGMGMGGGMGRGMGMGGGMGMGRGMGAGMGSAGPAVPYPPAPGVLPPQTGAPMGPEQELQMLRAQAQALQDQFQAVEARINELGRAGEGPALLAVVDADKCTGCGLCQEVCPTGAISMDEVARIDRAQCTGCGQCVAECPEDALSLRKA